MTLDMIRLKTQTQTYAVTSGNQRIMMSWRLLCYTSTMVKIEEVAEKVPAFEAVDCMKI